VLQALSMTGVNLAISENEKSLPTPPFRGWGPRHLQTPSISTQPIAPDLVPPLVALALIAMVIRDRGVGRCCIKTVIGALTLQEEFR